MACAKAHIHGLSQVCRRFRSLAALSSTPPVGVRKLWCKPLVELKFLIFALSAVVVDAGAIADTPDTQLTTLDEKIQRKLAKRSIPPSHCQPDEESEESDDGLPGVVVQP